MGNLAHNPVNDTRFNDLINEVKQFGRDAAEGKDALPKLAIRVVRAANDGVISSASPQQPGELDDAAKIYGEYALAESKKAIHEHTAGGRKANESKLRTLIRFGEPRVGIDPVVVLDRAIELRKELQESGEKCKPSYAAFVDVARAQLATDQQLSDDDIALAVIKAPTADKTLEKELEAISKKIDALVSGEGKSGLQDQSEQVIRAGELIKERLAALYGAAQQAEFMAQAKALGFHVTPQGNQVPPEVEPEQMTDDQLLAALGVAA